MPFTYKRKHEKYGTTSAGQMRSAIQAVLEGDSERKTAKRLGIPRATLQRYVKKAKNAALDTLRLHPIYEHPKIFNQEQGRDLADYLQTASRMHHGLTTEATKELAYQYAKKNAITFPKAWHDNHQAGI